MFSFQTKKAMAKALLTKNSPFYVQFYVSKACHLNCGMCNIVQANSDAVPFRTEDIEKIADNLVAIGAGVVLLTGGEPFLRNDIDEIVRVFKQRKLDIRMQTAGLYVKRDKIAKCVEYGARDINVSIDSLKEDLSDQLNGRKGSWRDAIRTIAYISQVFPGNDSVCALGCVLSPHNIDEVEAVLDFATGIGWWLSLVPAHITSPEVPLNFRGQDTSFLFREADFPRVKDLIARLKRKKRQGYTLFDSDDYLDSIYHFITTGQPNWRHRGICDTPNLYFAILPDGSFAPCCDYRMPEKIYLHDPAFPRLYRTEAFRRQVKEIASHCPGCNFGSFPEMTLSARSFSTIRERLLLQLRAKAEGVRPFSVEQLFALVDEIRARYLLYGAGSNSDQGERP